VIQTESARAKYAMSDVCLSTRSSQKRSSDEIEQELEIDGCHLSDDFEFALGAMIAAALGLAMWIVIFFIVKLVFS
jgi:hypothetical protein